MPPRPPRRRCPGLTLPAVLLALLAPLPPGSAQPAPEAAAGTTAPATAGAPAALPEQASPAVNPPTPEDMPARPTIRSEAASPDPAAPLSAPTQPVQPAARTPTIEPRSAAPAAPSRAPTAAADPAPPQRAKPMPAATSGVRPTPLRGSAESAPPADWPQPEEDFGRWERNTQQCEFEMQQQGQAAEVLPCHSVRLDQQLAGLLSIRFLPLPRERATPAQQLLFAGVLLPGSQPMRCKDRRCEPQWPIRVQLSALATSNNQTLGLPQARVVQGNCSLERNRVLCAARDHEGRRWQARGRW